MSQLSSFLVGFGSVLSFLPTATPVLGNPHDDAKALTQDCRQLGNDLRQGIEVIAREKQS